MNPRVFCTNLAALRSGRYHPSYEIKLINQQLEQLRGPRPATVWKGHGLDSARHVTLSPVSNQSNIDEDVEMAINVYDISDYVLKLSDKANIESGAFPVYSVIPRLVVIPGKMTVKSNFRYIGVQHIEIYLYKSPALGRNSTASSDHDSSVNHKKSNNNNNNNNIA